MRDHSRGWVLAASNTISLEHPTTDQADPRELLQTTPPPPVAPYSCSLLAYRDNLTLHPCALIEFVDAGDGPAVQTGVVELADESKNCRVLPCCTDACCTVH